MAPVLEKQKAISALDRFEARQLKRASYRKVHAKTESISKIAARIIRYRSDKHLTQAALAKSAGFSRKQLNEIEVLENTNPSLRTLEMLAFTMRMPVSRLVA